MTRELETIAREVKELNDYLAQSYETEPGAIFGKISILCNYLARTTELLSQAEYILNRAKGKASNEIDSKVSATRYKDVIMEIVANEQKVYRFVERLNASIVHILEGMRSQLSYCKEERRNLGG